MRATASAAAASPIKPSASAALPLHERLRIGQCRHQRLSGTGIANQSQREGRHLPHFRLRIRQQRDERRHAFALSDPTDRQRRTPADARFTITEQTNQVGRLAAAAGAATLRPLHRAPVAAAEQAPAPAHADDARLRA